MLCNPVDKTIFDADGMVEVFPAIDLFRTHQMCFDIGDDDDDDDDGDDDDDDDDDFGFSVEVTNQFEEPFAVFDVHKLRELCVPTQKRVVGDE